MSASARFPRRFRLERSAPVLLLLGTACVSELGPGGPLPLSTEPMSIQAWTSAAAAHDRAMLQGITRSPLLVVIDYSRPSTRRRLWVVDRNSNQILMQEYVAHAARSGGLVPTAFGNRDGSYLSSRGAFVTQEAYFGVRGLSLRLEGLEPGINDRARARGIVIHGTPNVSEARALAGNQGRTDGCPAVSMAAARRLIPLIDEGVLVYVWAQG